MDVGRPGGEGVTVAVLDTGVAYANRGRFQRSPDLSPHRFVRGYDFVDDDPYPNDDNGHGTHVASTIAEGTGNGVGLTGLAYGATMMPIKVLDRDGEGDSAPDRAGHPLRRGPRREDHQPVVRVPVGHHALEIPNILDAIRYARARACSWSARPATPRPPRSPIPARSSNVLSVGATTEHGCLADYSNEGPDLDLVAPGGGADAALDGDPNCRPTDARGARHLPDDLPRHERAPRVRASRAASSAPRWPRRTSPPRRRSWSPRGILGPDPTPDAIERRLEAPRATSARPGKDPHYGAGLLDAAAATDPAIPVLSP